MNMLFGDKVLTYLSSLGLGTPGRDLFYMQIPGTPAVCSAIVLTGGFHRRSDPVHRYTFSVLHRNTHISSGLSAITSLYWALEEKANIACPVEGNFSGVSLPGSYVRDTNNHVVYNLNFTFVTTQRRF